MGNNVRIIVQYLGDARRTTLVCVGLVFGAGPICRWSREEPTSRTCSSFHFSSDFSIDNSNRLGIADSCLHGVVVAIKVSW